jgi:two-component system, OmpR family, sensor histidine kinase ChvG
VGLFTLLIGILYVTQLRQGLIDARLQSLSAQGNIIAAAIAASASVETDAITLDPDKLLDLKIGESARLQDEAAQGFEFAINPEQVGPVLRRLVLPTRTRARLFDLEGSLVLDSKDLYTAGRILRENIGPDGHQRPIADRIIGFVERTFGDENLQIEEDFFQPSQRMDASVLRAFLGQPAQFVRRSSQGDIIASVAVPIQRFRAVFGVLVLSTQPGDIDSALIAERKAFLRVFAVAALVMTLLSLLMAGTIAGPVRRLAEAAERVRKRVNMRVDIPDFTMRDDEIGHLSQALRDMTQALYNRIAAIESFAADVAHELKNPLTSLRSAVETLPLTQTDEQRQRLLDVIVHDVRRLDRLISDISDASRLDAELQRQDAALVDMGQLLSTLVDVANSTKATRLVLAAPPDVDFSVIGHDSRLAQVFTNLMDNACSFSPPHGQVSISLARIGAYLRVTVEDDGPGIKEDVLERIFERFYTDRPDQGFGQNSGLGLSISKQIIDAHDGKIWAENRLDETHNVIGARFVVMLPAAHPQKILVPVA